MGAADPGLVFRVGSLGSREKRMRWKMDESAGQVRVLARVVAPGGLRVALESAEWLTPYAAETIAEHALRAGPGSRLEIAVASDVAEAKLQLVRRRFAALTGRGVEVDVHRDGHATT